MRQIHRLERGQIRWLANGRFWGACLLLFRALMGGDVRAADTLVGQLDETQTSWLVGKWQSDAETEAGAPSTSEFVWELDQRILIVRFTSGSTRAQAMVTFHPHDATRVRHHSADNRGGTGHGHWTLQDGKATLSYEHARVSGEKVAIALVHEKLADDRMRISIHNVDAAGVVSPDALYQMGFRRSP